MIVAPQTTLTRCIPSTHVLTTARRFDSVPSRPSRNQNLDRYSVSRAAKAVVEICGGEATRSAAESVVTR